MVKKSLILVLSATVLTACSSGFATKQYKISDEEAMKVVEEGYKAEQCLFPKEWKNNSFSGLSNEEKTLHSKYVFLLPLAKVVGSDNYQTIYNSPQLRQYTEQQLNKFSNANKAKFDKTWCNNLKSQYKKDLTQLQANIKQKKAQAAAKQKAEIARKKQEEKARKAREAYLRTPAGQAELARLQQQEYQKQMLKYQKQMAEAAERAADAAEAGNTDAFGLPKNSPFGVGKNVNCMTTFGYTQCHRY